MATQALEQFNPLALVLPMFAPVKAILLALLALGAPVAAAWAQAQPTYTLVVASTPIRKDAETAQAAIEAKELPASILYMETAGGKRFRVCVGAFRAKAAAEAARDSVAERTGQPDTWILELPADYGRLIVRPSADSLATPDTPPPPPAPLGSEPQFLIAYSTLIATWAQANYPLLDTYLHPEAGVFVLYSQGGRRFARRFRTLEALFESQLGGGEVPLAQRLLPNLEHYALTPLATDLPTPMCDGARQGYSDTGIFAGPPRPEQLLLSLSMRQLKQRHLGQPLTPEEEAFYTRLEQEIVLGVISTDAPLLRGLYFARRYGRWYLTAIDLVSPCGD